MGSDLSRRRIEPELLDTLPADDPAAMGSRRDLVWVNALMFQTRIMASLMRRHLRAGPVRILEVGAGDGAFMLSVARRLRDHLPEVRLVMLDQQDLVTDECRAAFAALGWQVETVVADVFDWMALPRARGFDAVTANLFLHHFEDEALAGLFAGFASCAPVFIATEPRRNRFALTATGFLRSIGANAVTLHDAAASVRAGFHGAELSRLWPQTDGASLTERYIAPFTHGFVATAGRT
jgi:2-polyprenyl-3-methyl-5-hydroxy-6-metoxy-1,4-benzoquinol methylase